jgi:hypothetical protein
MISTGAAMRAVRGAPPAFQLQQHGGPALLSQIGHVAATIGLIAAGRWPVPRRSRRSVPAEY